MQTVNVKDVSLDDLAGGALRVRVAQALQEILANIDDPNTDHKPRKITIEVVLEPTKDRSQVGIGFVVNTKPRHREEVQTTLFIERHGPDSFRVGEHNPKQLRLDEPTVRLEAPKGISSITDRDRKGA